MDRVCLSYDGQSMFILKDVATGKLLVQYLDCFLLGGESKCGDWFIKVSPGTREVIVGNKADGRRKHIDLEYARLSGSCEFVFDPVAEEDGRIAIAGLIVALVCFWIWTVFFR